MVVAIIVSLTACADSGVTARDLFPLRRLVPDTVTAPADATGGGRWTVETRWEILQSDRVLASWDSDPSGSWLSVHLTVEGTSQAAVRSIERRMRDLDDQLIEHTAVSGYADEEHVICVDDDPQTGCTEWAYLARYRSLNATVILGSRSNIPLVWFLDVVREFTENIESQLAQPGASPWP